MSRLDWFDWLVLGASWVIAWWLGYAHGHNAAISDIRRLRGDEE